MTSRFIAIAVGATAAFIARPAVQNESSKRRFYEDDSDVVPVPGTVVAAAGTEIKSLGPNRLVDGVSVRSPESLESGIRSVRHSVVSAHESVQQFLEKGYNKYQSTEKTVTSTVSGLHYKSEDLLPNSIYVAIATLSGTIVARQRGIVLKAFFPVALGLISFKYFLPQTFANTTGFVWKMEERFVPGLAHSQQVSIDAAAGVVHKIEKTAECSQKSLNSGVSTLKQKIASVTGLNVDGEVKK